MSTVEKAEKALEFLKNVDSNTKLVDIQNAAGTLGRCMATIGGRFNYPANYANLLHLALPILLKLSSNDSAEIRLLSDEALNKCIVSALPFHAYRINIMLQNLIDPEKSPRWNRAAISRVCIGTGWLRPGPGKIRTQAQTLIRKFIDILKYSTDALQLTMETMDSNLPRILNALANYTTDEEMADLMQVFSLHLSSSQPPVRRGAASCISILCKYREILLPLVFNSAIDELWPATKDSCITLGWFSVMKNILTNKYSNQISNTFVPVHELLQVYELCLHYLQMESTDHNIQNAVLECLSCLIAQSTGEFKAALLDKTCPHPVALVNKITEKKHRSTFASTDRITLSTGSSLLNINAEIGLASNISHNQTPYRSIEDLREDQTTPGTPQDKSHSPNLDHITKEVFEKLRDSFFQNDDKNEIFREDNAEEFLSPEYPESTVGTKIIQTKDDIESLLTRKLDASTISDEIDKIEDLKNDQIESSPTYFECVKTNIGMSTDIDVRLKYCTRLIASKFLLLGNKGKVISDRVIRVSVKASALSCLSAIIQIYPKALTLYLDKGALNNVSGNSDLSNVSAKETQSDFILERNVCFQDSLTESFSQDLLTKSIESQLQNPILSFASGQRDELSRTGSAGFTEKSDSLKDVTSNIFDSKIVSDLCHLTCIGQSVNSGDVNMTSSNITMNSNMTASNNVLTTDYPQSTSVDLCSSSMDLEMKFDHFGEAPVSLTVDTLKLKQEQTAESKLIIDKYGEDPVQLKDIAEDPPVHFRKKIVCRTNDVPIENNKSTNIDKEDIKVSPEMDISKHDADFESQHMSDIYEILENHHDPQIRGLVRLCLGNFISSVICEAKGDYNDWEAFTPLSKDILKRYSIGYLIQIIVKGLSGEIHSCVNHSLLALKTAIVSIINSSQVSFLLTILYALHNVAENTYWLCKVNLCKLYGHLPYKRLYIVLKDYELQVKLIMNTLMRLCSDVDQKVRKAASNAITRIIPAIYLPNVHSSNILSMIYRSEQIESTATEKYMLDIVKKFLFLYDLPYPMNQLEEQFKKKFENQTCVKHNLKLMISTLITNFMETSSLDYKKGILETLQEISTEYPPWHYFSSYVNQGLLEICLNMLEYKCDTVQTYDILLFLASQSYCVEMWHSIALKIIDDQKSLNENISEPSAVNKWCHLSTKNNCAMQAEKFLQITLKMLNILVHLIDDISPNVHLNKMPGIALPGSPVRRKSQDQANRQAAAGNADEHEDKNNLKKKISGSQTSNFRSNFVGTFANDPFYMTIYDNLKAAYSNHKINLDPNSSIFLHFISTVLDALAIQLEMCTEKEIGPVTEEILYYLKTILPLRPDTTVFCVTLLLKCLFATNMANQYHDFTTVFPYYQNKEDGPQFNLNSDAIRQIQVQNMKSTLGKRQSISVEDSPLSFKHLNIDNKNPKLIKERNMLIKMEIFARNKAEKKWETNKKELERYIKLLEPIVILALKRYSMQNDIPLQCTVLGLLNQLLMLRVNYCLLDRDMLFITFTLKQLEYVEQHEIPEASELVNCILNFLVHLSTVKSPNKQQLIDIPKLIQLCDGLMASGCHAECAAALQPLVLRVFSGLGAPSHTLGRTLAQELQVTREVVFYMLQKMMHKIEVVKLISCVLVFSQEFPESYYLWSQLAADTLLQLIGQQVIEIDGPDALVDVENLIDCIYEEILFDQSRIETTLKIMFQQPPDSESSSLIKKARWLSMISIILRKIITKVPETEILLSINYLKAKFISPSSIFFNIKLEIDPLNVQNVNENCANLSPDVILVRFLFRVLTYAITEVGKCNDINKCCKLEETNDYNNMNENHKFMIKVTLDLISCVKEMLYLTDDCLFPLMAKTAQNVLHNEQSGLNTGLYSPDENIPLTKLDSICQKFSWALPILSFNWMHLLIRLKFLEQKYWHKYLSSSRVPLKSAENGSRDNIQYEILQMGYVMAYCEYFVKNGLGEVIHLSWLLVNKIQILVKLYDDPLTRKLIQNINANASASGLLLQAIAARCHGHIKGKFALNTLNILKDCHESQSGPLIVLICLLLEKLQSAVALGFIEVAMDRCKYVQSLSPEDILKQLNKEDVQAALELLQKAKLHFKYVLLVKKINDLSAAVFDLSPLDLSQERVVNPHNVRTTLVDSNWFMTQIKNSCSQCINNNGAEGRFMHNAHLISLCNKEQMNTLVLCPDFNRNILPSAFKLGCDIYLKKLIKTISMWECEQFEKEDWQQIQKRPKAAEKPEIHSNFDTNILTLASSVTKFSKNAESKSQFYIPITDNKEKHSFENMKTEIDNSDDYKEINIPLFPDILQVSLLVLEKSLVTMIKLFPKQSRPSSFTDTVILNSDQTLDRYTKRCYQVFTDKLFHDEFIIVQNMVKGYVTCLHRILLTLQNVNYEAEEKVRQELVLSPTLTKYLALFCIIHLQYSAFLIKCQNCKNDSESLNLLPQSVHVEYILNFGMDCVSKLLGYKEVWCELNTEGNVHKVQSGINCLYTITEYFVQNTKPISISKFISTNNGVPTSDIAEATDKLLSMLQYWQDNFYNRSLLKGSTILSTKVATGLERLLIAFSRFDTVSSVTLIPSFVWQNIDSSTIKQVGQIELPIHSLQDTDILEAYLFRVNFIGWTSKKHFEEIWMGLLGALQGDGTHWAVQGIMQLLLSTLPQIKTYNEMCDMVISCPRSFYDTKYGMTNLKEVLIDNKIGKEIFQTDNLEFIPFQQNNRNRFFTYGQFSVEYLRAATGIQDNYNFRVRNTLRRVRKHMAVSGIDINSCLQLLMDIVSQMLNPQSQTSLSARCMLIACVLSASDLFTSAVQWQWLAGQLTLLAGADQRPAMQRTVAGHHLMYGISKALTVLDGFELCNETWNTCHYNNMVMALSSNNSILRQAAIHGCLFQIMNTGKTINEVQGQGSYIELLAQLLYVIQQSTVYNIRLSQYEQALRFSALFALVELGHTELILQAITFIADNQTHFCVELVITGVIRMIKCGLIPKEIQQAIIDKLIGVKRNYFNMSYSIHMLMIYLFNEENTITTLALHGEGSNMDPDQLMTSMERITILYKFITGSDNSDHRIVYASALKYFLRETLPPAAILSKVVIEFIECCKEAENVNKLELISRNTKWVDCAELTAGAVLEVFETALDQSQLSVLSGWLFEALCHLLAGKISTNLFPQCLLCLLVSSSENKFIRKLAPTAFLLLRQIFTKKTAAKTVNAGLQFANRRLLCIIAMHSGFSASQLMKLKEVCKDNENLNDLYRCLDSM